jgi:plasmid stabilization system protein ParE
MSSGYVLTETALADLDAIARYVEEHGSPAAAERIVLDLLDAFRLLASRPGIGHERQDVTAEPTVRFWIVLPYVIVFDAVERPVPILAIVHGSRAPSVIAEKL